MSTLEGSDMTASVAVTQDGFQVKGYEKLDYSFVMVDDIFSPSHAHLERIYQPWGRVLLVTDQYVAAIYADKAKKYFEAKDIALTLHIMPAGELHKTMDTMLSLVDAFNDFGLVRKEPVLVMGGGLVTDVCGYACASYRRSTNFVRIPTTLIGLIDASVSIKVAVNHGKLKNRLGAYHAPIVTFLDFTTLRTLPIDQVRNGFAELIKISSVADKRTWDLLVAHGEELIQTRFGRNDGSSAEVRKAADEICYRGIKVMLDLETPNLHEIGLDRVIAFGHAWSVQLELAPTIPFRHGHAISVDMAYSTTLAWTRGYITEAERDEILGLFVRVGLTVDHELFDEACLEKGTQAIMKTRDGKQRFVVPRPIGQTHFINDATKEELEDVLRQHKEIIKTRFGGKAVGQGAFVDAGDLGQDPANLLKSQAKKDPAVNGNVQDAQAATKLAKANGAHPNGNGVQTNGAHHTNGWKPNGITVSGLNGVH